MLFVRKGDMYIAQIKNNNTMKKSIWIFFTVILTVIVAFSLYQHFNSTSSSNILSDTASYNITKKVESNDKLIDNKLQASDTIVQANEIAEVKQKNSNINSNVSPVAAVKKDSDTLNLRDFGVMGNGKNETTGFQKALDASAGKILFIPKQQGTYYLTRQLRIPSNSTLVFDSKVIVQATDDLVQNHANFEVLFRIENANNVNIKGNNALFRMNKSAYKSEHNHIFMINGSSNVSINKARANNSGGDGFYIGAYKTKKSFCENIEVSNCIADNNRRQGLSVISVKDLIVKGSTFSNTKGTSPASGVDIEPNNNIDLLQNIKFIDCKAISNQRRGFMIQLSKVKSNAKNVSIIFENCNADGNIYGFASMYFDDNVKGSVKFISCIASNSKYSGFVEESCSASGVIKSYLSCTGSNNNLSGSKSISSGSSDFYIYDSKVKKRTKIGNSIFKNCKSIDKNGNISNGLGIISTDLVKAENIDISNFITEGRQKQKIFLSKSLSKNQNILIQ